MNQHPKTFSRQCSANNKMRQAIELYLEGYNWHTVTLKTGIPYVKLMKSYALYKKDNEMFNKIQKSLEQKSLTADREIAEVFTPDVEKALRECLKEFEYIFYGLYDKECRMLAYQLAVRNACNIPDNWKHYNNMASVEFIQHFKFKHHDLIIESPDRCSTRSLPRVISTKGNVTKFYDNLEQLVNSNPVLQNSARIYNLDETYVSTDPFQKTVNREMKADLITLCCIVSANGMSFPLIKIIPPNTTVNPDPEAPEAISITALGGQMTPEIFPVVLQHFIKYSNTSLQNPSILIIDIDLAHLSLDAFELAKESGVHFIALHPHMSKQLQPLVVLFDLLHIYYQEGVESSIKNDAKDDINMCKIADEAYVKAMTPDHITNAFKKCGIVPFDRDLFNDDDYLAFVGTELPCPDCKARKAYDDKIKTPVAEDPVDIVDECASETSKDLGESSTEQDSSQTLERNQKTRIDGTKMSPQQRGVEELDKLKRRMIRTVARLLKEKKTKDEVWEELKRESGSNCKNLWDRMRSLTMKKLKRLLDVDDRIELVPAVARMTLTDWLLYDLVIVHEKIDVIDRYDTSNTRPVLKNLFSLVQLFSIEDRSGDDLAEAWTAATVYYNSKGHQCSPMLMQRRWYQIKELTRHKMYKFWFNYRGNQRLLENAKQDSPSELQSAIASKYPQIITEPFPEWEERIEKRLVIMPEEFEVKMRKKVLMKPCDDNAPDVVIVEQKIDTIELDGDSDSEYSDEDNSRESAENIDTNANTPVVVQVKTEPLDDDIDTIEHSPYQLEEPRDRFQDEIERLQLEEYKILTEEDETAEDATPEFLNESQDGMMPFITSVQGGIDMKEDFSFLHDESINDTESEIKESPVLEPSIVIEDDDDEDEYIIPSKDVPQAVNGNTLATNRVENQISGPTNVYEDKKYDININIDTSVPFVDKMVKPGVQNKVNPITPAIATSFQVETKMDIDTEIPLEDEQYNVEVWKKEPVQDVPVSQDLDHGDEIFSDMNFADDGMEFADDGIEYIEHNEGENESNETPDGQQKEANEGAPKFDLKLLMNPVVYTTKLDEMTVYKDRPLFDTVDVKELVDKIILESKPTSARSVNVESEKNANLPIQVENQETIEIDDDFFQNDSVGEDDESNIFDESKRVKLSSNLLQKPRSRSYNPIQLCKNPDFNTRLKRLTVGFFSSTRNRVLLKACKPMTIDLSKAFESNLVDGTMYLKPSDQKYKIENNDKVNESTVSIAPSAVAVQSLMDTTDVDRILQGELKKRMLERSKTINLPNISVVRQINQQLLMAEVAPIMAQANNAALDSNAQNTVVQQENIDTFNDGAKRLKLDPVVEISEYSDDSQSDDSLIQANRVPNVVPDANFSEAMNTQMGHKTKNSVHVDGNPKSVNDRILEIQKKIKERQKNRIPTWLTKSKAVNHTKNKPLLTIDTLYKMLYALNPCYELSSKNNPKKKKCTPCIKQMKNATSENLQPPNPSENLTEKSVKPQEAAIEKPKVTNVNTPVSNTKNNAKTKKPNGCCWAKSKMDKIIDSNNVRIRLSKHKCLEGLCICCCREALRQAELDVQVKLIKCTKRNDKPTKGYSGYKVQSSNAGNINNKFNRPAVQLVNVNPNAANAHLLNSVKISVDAASQIDMDECETVHIVNNAPEVPSSTERIQDENVTIDLDADDDNDVNSGVSEQSLSDKCPSPRLRVYSCKGRRSTPLVSNRRINAVLKKDLKMKTKSSLRSVKSSEKLATGSKLSQITTTPSTFKLLSKDPETECSCRPNVAVDETSATLLIDGTNKCPRHTKSRVSKETRIYLNRRHMSLTERPFFIAKNKILLTNIKPPRPPTPPPPPPNPIKVTVPDGVQIVLLPDGTITYLVEPNVELTPEKIAAMPAILLGIQQQIKASGSTLPVEPDVPKPADDGHNLVKSNVDGKETQNNDETCKSPSAPSDSIQSGSDLQNKVVSPNPESEKDKEPSIAISKSSPTGGEYSIMTSYVVGESCFQNEVNQKLSSNEANAELVKNTNVADGSLLIGNEVAATEQHIDLDTIENPPTESLTDVGNDAVNKNETKKGDVGSDNAATSSNRNLLSDLMEMSGIMEEDIATVPQVSSTASLLPPDMTQPLEVSVVPGPSSISLGSAFIPGLSPLSKRKHTISAHIDEKVHELNPITSFAELKYACDQNGLFFKLDLSSGVIVAINVCIQKKSSDAINPVGTKFTEVIDLTDEKRVPTQEQSNVTTDAPPNKTTKAKGVSKIQPRKLSTMLPTIAPKSVGSGLKPAKHSLIKILLNKTEIPSAKSILDRKKQELLTKLSNNLKPLQMLQLRQQNINILKKITINSPKALFDKRLLNLNKIEAKIDLVDSDEPMEEEYLVDNSSDDSDDEPLANIALKKKRLSAGPLSQSTTVRSEPGLQNAQGSLDSQESVPQHGALSQDEPSLTRGKKLAPNTIDFEKAIDSIEMPVAISQHPPTIVNEPIPRQLVLSGDALKHPLPSNAEFLASNEVYDEDSQDDCILGV